MLGISDPAPAPKSSCQKFAFSTKTSQIEIFSGNENNGGAVGFMIAPFSVC
jgi:hypothetical protein